MQDFLKAIGEWFQTLGTRILAAMSASMDYLGRLIGHGFKVMLVSSIVLGSGVFLLLRTVLRYTAPAIATQDAADKWVRLMGPNGAFFSWLYYDVLALDTGLQLFLSALGFIVGAHMVYWTITGILVVVKRI